MFNPFYPFTDQLLTAFVKQGKKYFVRQTFNRGKLHTDENVKAYLLFSHYDHLNTAMDHFGAISYDPRRFLYSWDDPVHREKLKYAASGLVDYRIYSTVLKPDWERPVNSRVKDQLRLYIKKMGWNPRRDEGVLTNYEIQFGELYIRIKYAGREAKVKFEEIEKIS